jgi:hypothetical protein
MKDERTENGLQASSHNPINVLFQHFFGGLRKTTKHQLKQGLPECAPRVLRLCHVAQWRETSSLVSSNITYSNRMRTASIFQVLELPAHHQGQILLIPTGNLDQSE